MKAVLLFSPILGLLLTSGPLAAEDPTEFETHIRPLLQQRCVECHGAKKQKGELRLDARQFALKGGHDGPAVVAGKAHQSPLFQRVTSPDDDTRMPPEGKPLSETEVATLKRWIEAGAHWPETASERALSTDTRSQHWSVQPLRIFRREGAMLHCRQPAANGLPESHKTVELSADSANPIDAFLQAALREKGLAMSPEADRRTLIRRLSYDLHGLPPTPERVEHFCNDPDPNAYEHLVEELLASPHFGERWARHWLDIAHYADTHGFERDQLRPNAWRYRDYVIEALNADQPYDQFLREQIAGDALAPNNPHSVIATGFLAAGPWDFVGQVETKSAELQRAARASDLDDMVTQVITSTLGITIHCARCHDHKLDPISQKEYYSLCAVFAGVKRGERETNPAKARELANTQARLSEALALTRAQIHKLAGEGIALAELLPAGSGIDLRNGTLTSAKLGYHSNLPSNRLQKVEGVPGVLWVFLPNGNSPVPVADHREVQGVPPTNGHFWDAIANRPLNAQRSSQLGGTDFSTKGHSLLAMHANSGITFDLAFLRAKSGLSTLRLSGLVGFGADSAAAATRADFTVFVDGTCALQRLKLRKDETLMLDLEIPATAQTLTFIATDGGDGIGSDLLFIGDPKLLAASPVPQSNPAETARLATLRAELQWLESQLKQVPEPQKVYAVVSTQSPPLMKVQRRGNPEDEGAAVMPATFGWTAHAPTAFGGHDMPEAERRRALANWIVHPANPLTRRVLVNRLWHYYFGQGIVSTPSDFGLGGASPSHPELLDWLADELLKNGWSVKHVHKQILLSAAYRQSSTVQNAAAATLDAQNRLLWRQKVRRLDAESLRDAVLLVSGKLNLERGGPGFRDFQYTEAYAPIYHYITPDKPELWRRSIYRFIVRTTPHRFMSTLDCPDPANLTPVRTQTTTALQALTLSNNAFMLQQAGAMATRIETERNTDRPGRKDSPVERAFALAFQRSPTPEEARAAESLVAAQGLFVLCRMLLNANEFVYLD